MGSVCMLCVPYVACFVSVTCSDMSDWASHLSRFTVLEHIAPLTQQLGPSLRLVKAVVHVSAFCHYRLLLAKLRKRGKHVSYRAQKPHGTKMFGGWQAGIGGNWEAAFDNLLGGCADLSSMLPAGRSQLFAHCTEQPDSEYQRT